MRRLNAIIATLVVASVASGAEAACYEYQLRPANMGCAADSRNSADFTSGCSYQGEVVVAVQVACPATTTSVRGFSGTGGGSGGSYGNNCACDHSTSGGWH